MKNKRKMTSKACFGLEIFTIVCFGDDVTGLKRHKFSYMISP